MLTDVLIRSVIKPHMNLLLVYVVSWNAQHDTLAVYDKVTTYEKMCLLSCVIFPSWDDLQKIDRCIFETNILIYTQFDIHLSIWYNELLWACEITLMFFLTIWQLQFNITKLQSHLTKVHYMLCISCTWLNHTYIAKI